MTRTVRYPRDTLARTIWGESRGESKKGQEAVANVVMNRARNPRWWGRDVVTVCTKPWQFSCWNPDTAARRQLLAVTESNAQFRSALQIADRALAGSLADHTQNADHFHTHSARPLWSNGRRPTVSIGGHRFFRIELKAPA